ncbi:MAG: Stp1/IreP family PP2C-type Ser/Thr phosphatase [Gaiellales bacterium]|nr:Stp1/IreP family PP2C-type Ser/Thr phosphatase [Gaiellales bacterium]
MIVRHGAASSIGLVRRQNEDSYVAGDGVWAVCDGMGGAQAGEVASEAACRAVSALTVGSSAEDLQYMVAQANSEIFRRALSDSSLQGMGTTLTAAVWDGVELILAHVGDSRAYLLRSDVLEQLTRDHSLVGEMVRQGSLTPEEAAVHPHRSVITRALGTEEQVEPDIIRLPLQVADRLVLCSDGLTGKVADGRLAELLGKAAEPQAAAQVLVKEALANGGDDNVTVVVLFVEEGNAAADTPRAVELGPARRTEGGAGSLSPGGLTGLRAWVRRHRRMVLVVGVAVLLVAAAVAGTAVFLSGVYYVGTFGDSVALYQGVPHTVLGIELFTLVEVGSAPYSTLRPHLKARVDAHEVTTKEEGQRFLRGLVTGT